MSHDDFAAEPINGLPELPTGRVSCGEGVQIGFVTVDHLTFGGCCYFAVLTAWQLYHGDRCSFI